MWRNLFARSLLAQRLPRIPIKCAERERRNTKPHTDGTHTLRGDQVCLSPTSCLGISSLAHFFLSSRLNFLFARALLSVPGARRRLVSAHPPFIISAPPLSQFQQLHYHFGPLFTLLRCLLPPPPPPTHTDIPCCLSLFSLCFVSLLL